MFFFCDDPHSAFLFTEIGVFPFTFTPRMNEYDLPAGLPALVDSGLKLTTPPLAFSTEGDGKQRIYMMYTTSPRLERYTDLVKYHQLRRWTASPWSRVEIARAASYVLPSVPRHGP